MACYLSVSVGVQIMRSIREVLLEKKIDTKYMQVNVLRNKASMTKRIDDIPTH